MDNRYKLSLCICELTHESVHLKNLADELKKIDEALANGTDYEDVSEKFINMYCSLTVNPGFNRDMFQKLSEIGINLAWGEEYEKK